MYSRVVAVFMLLIIQCIARNPLTDTTDQNFQYDCVETSARLRSRHGSPYLNLDMNAVNYAKSRCRLISQYPGLTYGHTGLKGYGENLYWVANSVAVPVNCSQAVKTWYNEGNQYNYDTIGFSSSTGHFTQVVWRGSTGLGCARCAGRGQGGQLFETYVVCSYSPAGNIVGKFKENVLRLRSV